MKFYVLKVGFTLQFSSEELVKEVQNSIAEFKRYKQKYDEERVREQARMLCFFTSLNHLIGLLPSFIESEILSAELRLFSKKLGAF